MLLKFWCFWVMAVAVQAHAHDYSQPRFKGYEVEPRVYQTLVGLVSEINKELTDQQRGKLQNTYHNPKRDRGFCYVLSHCKQDHAGLKMREFSGAAKYRLHRLLSRIMSSQGYLKFLKIMEREELLEEMEDASQKFPAIFQAVGGSLGAPWQVPEERNYGDYYVAIFGKLAPGKMWALRLEGHHYSLNLTIDSRFKPAVLSASPVFLGVSPMIVPKPPKNSADRYPIWNRLEGQHLLGLEEQLARSILQNVKPTALAKAEWPRWPGPELDGAIDQVAEVGGLLAKRAEAVAIASQPADVAKMVTELLAEYFTSQRLAVADQEAVLEEMQESGEIYWKGKFNEPGQSFYFRIESEHYLYELLQSGLWSVSTEYAANHIHSSFRDLTSDWDHDRLSEHVMDYHDHDSTGKWLEVRANKKPWQGTVLLVPGSGGIKPWTHRWARFLAENGFAVKILNSFGPRGYKHRLDVGWGKATEHQASDIAQAIARGQRRSKSKQLYVMGFSMGAYSILKASAKNKAVFDSGKLLAGTVLFYPMCSDFVGSKGHKSILIIGAEKDTRSPVEECKRMLDMSPLKAEQYLKILKGSTHGFDIEEFAKSTTVEADDGTLHEMVYSEKNHKLSKQIVLDFLLGKKIAF